VVSAANEHFCLAALGEHEHEMWLGQHRCHADEVIGAEFFALTRDGRVRIDRLCATVELVNSVTCVDHSSSVFVISLTRRAGPP